MRYRRFAMFNVVGGVGWVASMTLTGYFLGQTIPGIQDHIEYVIAIVVFLSLLPLIIKLLRSRRVVVPFTNKKERVMTSNSDQLRQ